MTREEYIDVDMLLNQIHRQLNRAYMEHYGTDCYTKPQFIVVLSSEEIWAIRKWAAEQNPGINPHGFYGSRETIFGHTLERQRSTPYLKGGL